MRLDTGICVSCLLRKGLEGGYDEVSQAFYQSVLGEVDAPHKSWFLGNYEILEQIGCGGMGVIYRARQRHSRRIVAVKRVLSYRADSHGALQRFRREAQAVASLDHPNILPIYEVSESEDGLPFFSMKLAEKGSLHDNTASLHKQPRKCVELMTKVALAVEYAHSCGVLHRDLKPGNILLDDRGEPLVSDFGLAKLLDGSNDLTRSVTTFGTAGFIAPEQASDTSADLTPSADVYSLGAVLFNLLAGRPPFSGSNPISVIRKASETQAPKLRSVTPSLDRDLETICARCLERDPKARYQSAGDLAAELERWLGGHPIVARPVSPPARVWRWSQRNPKLVGAATFGLLLGAIAVWLFRGEPQPGRAVDNRHVDGLLAKVTHPTGVSRTDTSVLVPDRSSPFGVPGNTSPQGFDATSETQVTAAPPITAFINGVRDRAPESGPITNKVATDAAPASPKTGLNTSSRDRSSEAGLRTKKIVSDVAAAPPPKGVTTSARDHSSEAALVTSKIATNGPASIQGLVKDAKGEPIKGADLRIESRNGKQVLSTVKTDSNGRYSSQRLQPGVYRVSLVVNGAVKASIENAQAKANQPTQLNFDFKPTSQAGNTAKGRKHMVWVPNRTGSHIGGTWVEVDDKGNEHSESNMQTYAPRR
jgi:serine/threonine protein kinase